MKNLYSIGVAVLVFVSCHSSNSPVADWQIKQVEETKKIETHIDSSIQGDEREVMRGVLSDLLDGHRNNVVYIDENGNKHFNKPSIRNWLQEYKKISYNSYLSPSGGKISFDDSEEILSNNQNRLILLSANYVCPVESKAVYRRVWSNDGYSYVRAEIGLPGNGTGITAVNAGPGYAPYVMLGGRTNTSEVDAGFQFSPTNNWWTPFVRISGGNILCFDSACSAQTPGRKQPGNKYIDFYVPSDGRVALVVSDVGFLGIPTNGTTVDVGTPLNATIVAAVSSWKKSGIGQRLKRTTSITNLPQNSGTSIKAGPFQWRRIDVGVSGSALSRWNNAIYASPGSCTVNDPAAGNTGWVITGLGGGAVPPADEDVTFSFLK